MQITCPDCAFTREVDENAIPSTSSFATCPKCKTRFRFRADLPEGDHSDLDTPGAQSELAAGEGRSTTPPEAEKKTDDIWASMDRMRQEWDDIDQEEDRNTAEPYSRQTRNGEPQDDEQLRLEAQRAYQQGASQMGKIPLYSSIGSVPWEYKGGFLNPVIFFRTVALILTRIPQFFAGINPFSSVIPAWVFMIVVRFIELAAVLLGTQMLVSLPDGTEQTMNLFQVFNVPAPTLIALALFTFTLIQFAGSAIINQCIKLLLGPGKANFRLTFKIMAYAYMPSLFSIIPGIGTFLSFFGWVTLLFLGIRHAYRFNWQQTMLAVVPYLLTGLTIWAFMLMQMRSGMGGM